MQLYRLELCAHNKLLTANLKFAHLCNHYGSYSIRLVRFVLMLLLIIVVVSAFANKVLAAEKSEVELKWEQSPHADSTSESFRHWDKDGEIPTNCATCHSMSGFHDFTGEDGSKVGVIDNPASTDTVVGCATCHHDAIKNFDEVSFPSGFKATNTGSSTACLVCHQGRLSTVQVNEKLDGMEDDVVLETLSFLNIHYRAAGASLFGTDAKGGYEYPDKQYTGQFSHPAPFSTCTGCHDAHALVVKEKDCSACHSDINELHDIRLGSTDFDGNGDESGGVATELTNLHELLGSVIHDYAANIANSPILYHAHNYPYFFEDTNKDGEINEGEAAYPNRYQHWTPRLLRAAYNYQFFEKDPGFWAHNPKYAAQLLIDSLKDLAHAMDIDTPELTRP